MLFSSIPFLFYFLPITLIVYAIAPRRLKNASLVLFSLIFYAWGEPKYVLLMLITILVGYVFGLLIDHRKKQEKKAGIVFAVSVVCVLASLAFFKYADFAVSTVNAVGHASFKLPNIALPIGISFYSFQLISYLADVYRGTEAVQKNFIDLAAYIAFFPQLIAGPIVRYGDIALQLRERTHSREKIAKGARRFIFGLSKKILVANMLAELCAVFHASTDQTILFAWLYAVAFSLQIYFDFSGYSDMAIGLGSIFGFDFPENFNYPFISANITEFWRRWHMTLGSWFRDYVYIPLGGNRVPRWKHLRNILVVWALTGLWHGANWNFVCWGLYYGLWLLLEKFFLGRYLKKNRVVSHIYTILLTLIGFVIFDATGMGEAVKTIGSMFGIGAHGLSSAECVYYFRSYARVLVIALVGATPLPKSLASRFSQTEWGEKALLILEPVLLILLVVLCTSCLVDGSFNPFLYFRF